MCRCGLVNQTYLAPYSSVQHAWVQGQGRCCLRLSSPRVPPSDTRPPGVSGVTHQAAAYDTSFAAAAVLGQGSLHGPVAGVVWVHP